MPSISIRNKHYVEMLIDTSDLSFLTQHKEGYWCFRISNDGRAAIKGTGKNSNRLIKLHRLIMGVSFGVNVKHVNGDTLDNRKENLRVCLDLGYQKKVSGFGLSQFRGVAKNGKNWKAVINYNRVAIRLGNYDTQLEAALAYDAKARQLGCGVRFLNFPDEVVNVNS